MRELRRLWIEGLGEPFDELLPLLSVSALQIAACVHPAEPTKTLASRDGNSKDLPRMRSDKRGDRSVH